MTRIKTEIIVKGSVQKAGYRDHVQEKARSLDVKGYVENQRDGSVKIVCEADEADLEKFIKLINIKQDLIAVEKIQTIKKQPATGEYQYFDIKYGSMEEEMGERMVAAVKIAVATRQDIKDVHEDLKNMHKDLKGGINSMHKDLTSSIQSMHKDVKESTESMHKDLKGSINSMHKDLTSSIQSMHKDVKESTESMHKDLKGSINSMHKDLTSSIQSMHKDVKESTESMHKDLKGSINSMHKDLTSSIQSMHKDVKESTESMHSDMNQNFKEMAERYDAISKELLRTREELEKAVDSLVRVVQKFLEKPT
jgi:acylphosphatase/BMFP domain-containing protein YqiC